MDRRKILPVLLPFLVFGVDIWDLFLTPQPPKLPRPYPLVHNHTHKANLTMIQNADRNQTQTLSLNHTQIIDFNHTQTTNLNQTQLANLNQTQSTNLDQTQSANLNQTQERYKNDTLLVHYCALCSYRSTAVSVKLMVEKYFPGMNVILVHYTPPTPKYLLLKLISTVQIAIILLVLGGAQIFPALGARTPSWYYPLYANKFSVIGIPWLLGSIAINYLQNAEAFEIYLNSELVFCKLLEGRFPGGNELQEIVASRLAG